MTNRKINIDKEILIELYINKNMTVLEVANELGYSTATINRQLKLYNIKKDEKSRRAAISKTKQNKTEEEKKIYSEHISKARKGKGLGIVPWNKGTKGLQVAWNKGLHTTGKPRTAESLEKARQTCLERYGVNWACQRQEARLKGQNSTTNLAFEEKLKALNIEYSREFPINSYSYDFKAGKYLIELDPYATHNSTWGIRGNKEKPYTYHKDKSTLAADNGYFCIHIFDWDDQDKILNKFIPKIKINADDCILKEIDRLESKEFLNKYHPQNYTNDLIRYGLFYNDELVEVMTFGRPRYNKKYQWEILRVCAKAGYHILAGSKKLLDYFIVENSPETILVYCDLAKLSGKLYENLGFTKLKKTNPARHWYNPKVKKHITDAFLWSKGFDRLFGTNYGKTASNTELMLEHGFVEIYDCGQATYVWKNKELV